MLIEDFFHVPVAASLFVIISILTVSIVSSVIWPDPNNEEGEVPPVTMKE
jgi:hypothetical protein